MSWQLGDVSLATGGFCAVPGSHKSNFPVPPALGDLADEELNQYVVQPEMVSVTTQCYECFVRIGALVNTSLTYSHFSGAGRYPNILRGHPARHSTLDS